MKPFLKPSPAKLVIALIMIITAIVIHSCKKDRSEQARAAKTTDPVINLAQRWYDSLYPAKTASSKRATQSVDSTTHDWSQRFKPYWANANVFTQSGMTFIELPAIKYGDMAVSFSHLKDSANLDFGKSGTMTDLLIVKQGTNFGIYAMTILADSAYLQGDYTKVAKNSYEHMDSTFTGAVFFHRMNGSFVNGWRYQNGQVTRALSPGDASGTTVQNTGKLQVNVAQSCSTIQVTTYWLNCSYSEGTNYTVPYNCYVSTTEDYYQDCSGTVTETGGGTNGSPPPPCQVPSAGSPPPTTPPTSPSDASIKGKLRVDVAAPPTGGGTTPPPAPPLQPCPTETTKTPTTTQKITDSIKNACLRSMVEATMSANVTNQINTLIQNVFGSSTKMNITFVDAALPDDVDGQTPLPVAGVVNGSLNVRVTLDNSRLPGYSQQYIARVIMHEALHAYIVATSNSPTTSNVLQHETMMQNYVVLMAQSLQQMFPGLSTADAQNLALGGLQDAPTFISTIESNLGLLGSFEATNLAYSDGSRGSRCNP